MKGKLRRGKKYKHLESLYYKKIEKRVRGESEQIERQTVVDLDRN